MNDIDIKLANVDEMVALLRKLPGTMGKNFVQSAWVKASKPIKAAMVANIPEDTGTARKSVTTVRGKSAKTPTVFVGPRQGRSKRNSTNAKFLKSKGATSRQIKQVIQADAWYLRFLWRGTRYIKQKEGLGGYESAVNRALPSAISEFSGELRKIITRSWKRGR